jgi:isopenicillin N synthase-like dioxygenase
MNQPIPSVSYRALCHGEQIDLLADACQRWGFFRLTDHKISPGQEKAFLEQTRSFFCLPSVEKNKVTRTVDNPWGYYDRELTKNRQDWKEIYDLGIDQQDSQYTSSTPWPRHHTGFESTKFKDTMLSWHAACEHIGLTLIEAICQSLNVAPNTLSPSFAPSNTSFLRLNHYPPCDNPANSEEDFPIDGNLGISHHTDAGAVTVLLQDEVRGLQVRHENHWHTVEVEPGSLIVNVGDLIQVWSNHRYQAPLHRVITNAEKARISAAFFLNPSFDTNCVPLGNATPRYSCVNWGEFRAGRSAGDYANVGTEVQITDYQLSSD